jgi:hypothetical protein
MLFTTANFDKTAYMKIFFLFFFAPLISWSQQSLDFSSCKLNDPQAGIFLPAEFLPSGELEFQKDIRIHSRVAAGEKQKIEYAVPQGSLETLKIVEIDRNKKGEPVRMSLNAPNEMLLNFKYINNKCLRTQVIKIVDKKQWVAFDNSLCQKLLEQFKKIGTPTEADKSAAILDKMRSTVEEFRKQIRLEEKDLHEIIPGNSLQDAILRTANCRRELGVQ